MHGLIPLTTINGFLRFRTSKLHLHLHLAEYTGSTYTESSALQIKVHGTDEQIIRQFPNLSHHCCVTW